MNKQIIGSIKEKIQQLNELERKESILGDEWMNLEKEFNGKHKVVREKLSMLRNNQHLQNQIDIEILSLAKLLK